MDEMIIPIITGLIIACAFLLIAVFWLLLKMHSTQKKLNTVCQGIEEQNLIQIIQKHISTLDQCQNNIDAIKAEFKKIRSEYADFFRKIGLVRFQAFSDTGGDQSFALALLNSNNNGFIITTMYRRDFSKIFAKSIVNGKAEQHKLTDEEQQALNKALKQ